jgi:hypothetical protein
MKKKVVVAVASVSSTEAFPIAGLALQLEVPTTAIASIPSQKVWEECWNSDLNDQLKAVDASIHLKAVAVHIQLEATMTATSKAAQLRVTLPTASQVLGPYENPVT